MRRMSRNIFREQHRYLTEADFRYNHRVQLDIYEVQRPSRR